MSLRDLAILALLLQVCTAVQASECEVSLPDRTNVPGWKPEAPEGFMWVGNPTLAAMVPDDGNWTGMGPDRSFSDKWWWSREGCRAHEEPEPELVVTATRLGSPANSVRISHATNAFGPDWDLMLVGMEFPSAGCWEVVGSYHGHELRFVFDVGS